jgi:hypothetical protein
MAEKKPEARCWIIGYGQSISWLRPALEQRVGELSMSKQNAPRNLCAAGDVLTELNELLKALSSWPG